jgi:hypothetical protein
MNNGRKIVYIDWNSLKGIKDSLKEPFISISNLLTKYKDEIVIPYSPSHLIDLNKNYEANKEKVDSDLNFLKEISDNNIIAIYFGINETQFEQRDLIKFFHEIRKDKDEEQSVSKIFDEINDNFGIDIKGMFKGIDIKSILPKKEDLEKSESGKEALKQYQTFFETGCFASLLDDISKMNDNFQNNPQDFNDLTKALKEDLKLDSNISNLELPIQRLDSILPQTSIGKRFSELVIEDAKRYHKEPIFFDYYLSAYNQLGLFGFRPDKLSKKNRFNNSIQDGFHSFYGSNAYVFITNDKVMYHRSRVLFEAFGVATKLIKTFEVDDNQKLIQEMEQIFKEK